MSSKSYRQFCPIAFASEVLGNRWTVLVVRELLAGSTRFNDLRRGVPRMSSALLSTRLRELEEFGVVERVLIRKSPDLYEYGLTPAGRAAEPLVMAMGHWAHQWLDPGPFLRELDPNLLMWDIRRNLVPASLPKRRLTIKFAYSDVAPKLVNWWLLVDPKQGVDLCIKEPGFDVDLFVNCDLPTMVEIWMGRMTVARAKNLRKLKLTGRKPVADQMQSWLGLSVFARANAQST